MERFDICIPTLNSARTLRLCLKSINDTMDVSRILVCDGYSTDGTPEIAKEFGCKILFERGRLGLARTKLMKAVKTKRFFFIDADIVVNREWYRKILYTPDKKSRIGAVSGYGLGHGLVGNVRKLMITAKDFLNSEQRAFTSNTLVRKEATLGIMLPNISRGEDQILKRKMEASGWRWLSVKAFCRHLKSPSLLLKEAYSDLFYLSRMEKKGIIKYLSVI